MQTRPVIDGDLRDTEPAEVREHRDEAMQLSVDAHSLHDLRAIRLEPAVDVVQVDSREQHDEPVEDLRQEPSHERIAAL